MLSDFWLQTGLFVMATAIGAVGLTLLVGVAGQLSLGHAAFAGIGAYVYTWSPGESTTTVSDAGAQRRRSPPGGRAGPRRSGQRAGGGGLLAGRRSAPRHLPGAGHARAG